MREIAYRAWDIEECRMGEVQQLDLLDGFVEVKFPGVPVAVNFPIERVKLMQYTGLNDQNEVKIFEDDLFMNGESKRTIEIRGGNSHAITLKRTATILLSFIVSQGNNRVIGNIHENPTEALDERN